MSVEQEPSIQHEHEESEPKPYMSEGKADEAGRINMGSLEKERKARYFRVLFGFFFFHFFSLISISNLNSDIKEAIKEDEKYKAILDEKYPKLLPSISAMLIFDSLLLIIFLAVILATLRLPKLTLYTLISITILLMMGKIISEFQFLSQSNLNEDFRVYLNQIQQSDIDQCVDLEASKCRVAYTWNFCFYECVLDLIFGTISSIIFLFVSRKEKLEIISKAVVILPTTENPNEKQISQQQQTEQAKINDPRNQSEQQEDVSPEKDFDKPDGVSYDNSSPDKILNVKKDSMYNLNESTLNDSKLLINPAHNNSQIKILNEDDMVKQDDDDVVKEACQ